MTAQLRVRWRSAVLSRKGPKPNASTSPAACRLTAAALAEYMAADGGSAFPGERTLADVTSLDRRTVRAALATLVRDGWLTVRETGRKGSFGASLREYAAAFPEGINGTVSVPSADTSNGTVIAPFPQRTNGTLTPGNGTVSARQWDSGCPRSAARYKKGQRASAPAPEGAALALAREKITEHYLGQGYPRADAERLADANVQESERRRAGIRRAEAKGGTP